jgi:hypothetical protein
LTKCSPKQKLLIKKTFNQFARFIANKKAINRPKDQIDVLELEKIKLVRKEMGLV